MADDLTRPRPGVTPKSHARAPSGRNRDKAALEVGSRWNHSKAPIWLFQPVPMGFQENKEPRKRVLTVVLRNTHYSRSPLCLQGEKPRISLSSKLLRRLESSMCPHESHEMLFETQQQRSFITTLGTPFPCSQVMTYASACSSKNELPGRP